MRRTLLVITAALLFIAALAGWAWFLSGQGLENADRWASVVGLFVNTLLTTVSLVLAWLAWRAEPADQSSGTDAGPRETGGTTYNNTFTASEQAIQYNAPGGSMTINNDGEHHR